MTNIIGLWFVGSIIVAGLFGAFCVAGRGDDIKPLDIVFCEILIKGLKWVTSLQVRLENKVYTYKVRTNGTTTIDFSSHENDAMKEVVETLSKERKRNPRSHALDEQVKSGRVKFNKTARKSFEDNLKEFFDNKLSKEVK